MDPDDQELVVRLCARAGMIMEDASVVAITIAGEQGAQLDRALAGLAEPSRLLALLIDAAGAVARLK